MSKYLIVGTVAGGATTAARLGRLDEYAEVILLERGDYISCANCGLPYYAGIVIKDRSKLFVMTPEKFRATLAVDVRTGHEAVEMDPKAKTLSILEKSSGRAYAEPYDVLVLSPGAEPMRPTIPGIGGPAIFALRSVPDIDCIKEHIDARRPERAVVIGAGFIGLEMAENLRERGVFVTVVEALDQVMNVIDPEMAAIVHQQIKAKGVEPNLSDSATAFERRDGKVVAKLKSGKDLPTDMVILSIGVMPDTGLAREAGLSLDQRGAILVDGNMRTSESSIFAVGDAVACVGSLTGKAATVPLAGPANKQARIAADTIVLGGGTRAYGGAIGTSIAKVFDLRVASTGPSEKACDREGLVHEAVIVHPSSHAGYYPDAKPFSLKVVFEPAGGKLLEGQAIGYEGVDKRIDVIAAFLCAGAGIDALARFEHAYAPPFASAKDPVNYAGFVAGNLSAGLSAQVRRNDVACLRNDGALILDVRTPEEFVLGHIEGAINIPTTELRARLGELPRDRFILLYCGVGIRGYLAERILRQNGWTGLANLCGGWKTFEAATARRTNEDQFRAGALVPGIPASQPLAYAEGSGLPEAIAARSSETIRIDACGLQCPGPIMRLKAEMDRVAAGTTLRVSASDPGLARDARSWCRLTGNDFVGSAEGKGIVEVTIQKSSGAGAPKPQVGQVVPGPGGSKAATIIVVSDDFDRALASFVIAKGAAASGKEVTMFFTFWGLSVIKRRARWGSPRTSWAGCSA